MGVPDASTVASAKERGIISETEAAALIKAANLSAPLPPSREEMQPRHSEDGKLAASAHWLPPVPTGQPIELPGAPVELPGTKLAPRETHNQSMSRAISDDAEALGCLNDAAQHAPKRLSGPIEQASSSWAPRQHEGACSSAPSSSKSARLVSRLYNGARASMHHFVKTRRTDVHEHLWRGRYGSIVLGNRNSVQSTGFKQDSRIAAIASSKHFESLTLFVISLNALWIGVDIELNDASTWLDAHWVFQLADNCFCAFFTFEVLLRFLAMNKKAKCFQPSFIFDVALVMLMIFETWVLTVLSAILRLAGSGQGLRQLSILRLLRLIRLTRIGRLMKMIPELMTLIKGMVSALRSVATTLVFLMTILWIFGIIFVQVYKDEQDNELFIFFNKLGVSMVTLFVNGTLLDDLNVVAGLLKDDSMILLTVFFIFVLISSMTLLNMLIGVLTQGVSDTASSEKERLSVSEATRILKDVFNVVDINGDAMISKDEFEKILADQGKAIHALTTLGINEDRLLELSRQLFEDEDADIDMKARTRMLTEPTFKKGRSSFNHSNWVPKSLTFIQFIDELLLLKPGSSVSVRDVMGLRRRCTAIMTSMGKALKGFRKELDAVVKLEALEDVADKHGRQLEHRAGSSNAQESAATTVELMVPVSKLSSVPTELLFDELHRRLQARPQRSWQGMDGMCVESMP